MRLAAICLPLALLLALALPAAPALADDLPAASEFFDEYDQNADGKVTQEEFGRDAQIFRLLDKNGDGAITPDDLGLPADYKPDPKRRRRPEAKGVPGRPGAAAKAMERFRKQLQRMDTDKDGRVSKEEWKGPENAFDRFDRNKDGFLDTKDAPRTARGGERARAPKRERPRGPDAPDEAAMLGHAKEQFKLLDKNGDGKLTAEELPNPGILGVADGNRDGGVTLEEFLAFVKQRMAGPGAERAPKKGGRRRGRFNAGMLRTWDRDRDGKVSREEFPGRDEMFQRLDTDKDGFLTPKDVEARRGSDRRQKGAGAPRKRAAPPVPEKSGDLIARQDTDGDGKLNRAEFKGTAQAWRELDKNGDGWVTKDELGK